MEGQKSSNTLLTSLMKDHSRIWVKKEIEPKGNQRIKSPHAASIVIVEKKRLNL